MNKSDVIDRVAGSAGVARQQAENVLDAFFDTVRSAARSGDRVAWPGFGSFTTTQRKARTGRNPRTGESVRIPATKAVRFSASSALKDFLNTGAGARKGAAKKSAAGAAGAGKTGGTRAASTARAGAAGSTRKAGPAKKVAAPPKAAAKSTKAGKAAKGTRAR